MNYVPPMISVNFSKGEFGESMRSDIERVLI